MDIPVCFAYNRFYDYAAKMNAEVFNYDYLAERIAEETCKKLMIIEQQKRNGIDNGIDCLCGSEEQP